MENMPQMPRAEQSATPEEIERYAMESLIPHLSETLELYKQIDKEITEKTIDDLAVALYDLDGYHGVPGMNHWKEEDAAMAAEIVKKKLKEKYLS